MLRTLLCVGLIGMAAALGGCVPNSGACDSVGNAVMTGMLSGVKDGLTGQDSGDPCAPIGTPQVQPQQAEQQQPNPADLPKPSREELVRKYGARHADMILSGNIDKGMNQDEVALGWGPPSSQSKDKRGRIVWEYGNDSVVFTRGKVSDVRHRD